LHRLHLNREQPAGLENIGTAGSINPGGLSGVDAATRGRDICPGFAIFDRRFAPVAPVVRRFAPA
jgi:hypothetical protein